MQRCRWNAPLSWRNKAGKAEVLTSILSDVRALALLTVPATRCTTFRFRAQHGHETNLLASLNEAILNLVATDPAIQFTLDDDPECFAGKPV
jgi:hypothetical protein